MKYLLILLATITVNAQVSIDSLYLAYGIESPYFCERGSELVSYEVLGFDVDSVRIVRGFADIDDSVNFSSDSNYLTVEADMFTFVDVDNYVIRFGQNCAGGCNNKCYAFTDWYSGCPEGKECECCEYYLQFAILEDIDTYNILGLDGGIIQSNVSNSALITYLESFGFTTAGDGDWYGCLAQEDLFYLSSHGDVATLADYQFSGYKFPLTAGNVRAWLFYEYCCNGSPGPCDNNICDEGFECVNGECVIPDCTTFENDSEALCNYVLANPDSPLAFSDCDNGGVDNITECSNDIPTDPIDADDDIIHGCPIVPCDPLPTIEEIGNIRDNLLAADMIAYVEANGCALSYVICTGTAVLSVKEIRDLVTNNLICTRTLLQNADCSETEATMFDEFGNWEQYPMGSILESDCVGDVLGTPTATSGTPLTGGVKAFCGDYNTVAQDCYIISVVDDGDGNCTTIQTPLD